MKLRTLAIAVAMASVATAAQADLKISGDIGVGYFKSGAADGAIMESGSEINFDASETVGAVTYYGHLEADVQGDTFTLTDSGADTSAGSNVAFEELRVGAKGAFGDIRFGHLGDNGCGRVQVGGSNEVWLTHKIGGCVNNAAGGISYTRDIGKATMSVSHRPGDEETSIGVAGTVGPVSASIGYTDLDGATSTAMGLAGKLGPVGLGFRYGKPDGGDAVHGINAIYTTASGINVYGGVQTSDAAAGMDKEMSIGFKKVVGMTDFIFEAKDTGAAADSTNYGIGLRHRF